MKLRVFVLSIYLIAFGCRSFAAAKAHEDVYELPTVVAVDNKKFNPIHDFSFHVGVLPLDAFYKAYDYGVSYTYGWKNYLRWEVINFSNTSTSDSGLKKDLINNFQVQPAGILDSIKSYYTTNLVYTPLYSKNLFMNESIIRGELSFVLGGGSVSFKSGEKASLYGGGLILRYFLSAKSSVKLDTRYYNHTAAQKSSNSLMSIDLGFSYSFGGIDD